MRHGAIVAAMVVAAGAATALAQPITPELAAKHQADIDGRRAGDVDLLFDTGSATLKPDATKQLTHIVRWAEKHPSGIVLLDGYADPRGSDVTNVRLSARRAEAVRDLLVSLGVDEQRIVLGIFGEDGARRASYVQDRRVTASVTLDPLYEVVDDQLAANATALVWNEPVTLAELEGPNHPAVIATR